MLGTVIKYDRVSAYGFIVADDESLPDFFVIPKFIIGDRHHRFLMAGWRVEFDPVDVESKPQAHNVRILFRPIAVQRSASNGSRP